MTNGTEAQQQVWVTTANGFEGYRVLRYLGIVRGITVRSRGALGQIGAGFQRLVGGNITLYTEMCEHAREEAFELMCQHAIEKGANGVLAMRYDATEVDQGTTEVLAYGTAVVLEAGTPAT
ncbi:MAG TPA: YbjQ family protein [Armatimonadota bacterium]